MPEPAHAPVENAQPWTARSRWLCLALGLAYALLAAGAFPPVSWWPLAFVAPVPLYAACQLAGRTGKPWRAGLWTALGVLPLWVLEQRWLMDVAGLWYVLLAAYMSLFAALAVAIPARLVRPFRSDALAFATTWIGLETVRGEFIWDGYAWFFSPYPLIEAPGPLANALTSAASMIGCYGLSWCLVATVAGIAAIVLYPREVKIRGVFSAALGLTIWVICSLGPGLGSVPIASDQVTIAVIQTNVPQNNKERPEVEQVFDNFDRWLDLTRRAAAGNPDLIVWPETMFPGMTLNAEAVAAERAARLNYTVRGQRVPSTDFHDRLLALQAELKIPLLVGGIAYDNLKFEPRPDGRVKSSHSAKYNSAFMIRGGCVEPGRYDKLELMAFGETVPHVGDAAWVKSLVSKLSGTDWVFDLNPGRQPFVFELELPTRAGQPGQTAAFAAPICFEGTMPRLIRRLAGSTSASGQRPRFLVSLTNDGWFGPHSGGREQHLQTMQWRAIESGLPIVRAANTGISTAISSGGATSPATETTKPATPGPRVPPFVEGIAINSISLPSVTGPSGPRLMFGSQVGSTIGWLFAILTLGFCVNPRLVPFVRKRPAANVGAPDSQTGAPPETRS